MMTKNLLIVIALMFASTNLTHASEKFQIDQTTLVYDTEMAKNEADREITWEDADHFASLLKDNPDIRTLKLLSNGGLTEAALYFADIVIDYELDTIADRECSSACVTIFLAGENRTLTRGSWLGFHKSSWDSESMKSYYESERETENWSDPFVFSEWLYEQTQADVLSDLEYMLERGVAPGFAIQTLRADSDDMWYPRRKALINAGILTQTKN